MVALRQSSHERFAISDEADAGAVRRTIAGYADRLHAGPTGRAHAELVATELATNLVRHAKPGGWILTRPVEPAGIEFLAVDAGPGIPDPARALAGQSAGTRAADTGTWSGGLGCGLAAVRRASADFDVHTERGRGTVVLSLVDLTDGAARTARTWAGVSIGVTPTCGDGWAVAELADSLAVVVVDGLGHGAHASVAADAAIAAFARNPDDITGYLPRANERMRGTRGGAVMVCRLAGDTLHYVGVGNVNGRVVAGTDERGLACASGTLGLKVAAPRVRLLDSAWPAGATLALWTDGLTTRVDLSADPDLLTHHPAVIAAVLHREHTRERDDATVVVLRHGESP